ncbi:efflux RND transporter permease subunit [Rarobacter faecitabidus]|uniref:RND superfamily putative drug exporter n=1 Tax=Rarobacter faecitabidus TaxID=13243 RepID=A0A542ZP40_RARFA|nr:MMPL family transporter [Rarobacter faecitabidus]TQL62141.1 RND superfamily putative drug exporter [Rarobacter faecitabidus]
MTPGATRGKRWLRTMIPALIVVAWLTAAGIGGPLFGKVSEVSSNDSTAYLPSSAESTQVSRHLTDFAGDGGVPAVVVIAASEPLAGAGLAAADSALAAAAEVPGVLADSPAIPSEDGRAVQAFLSVDSDTEVATVVEAIRAALEQDLPAGLDAYVTGPAGFAADLGGAFAGIDGLLLLVALVAVLAILLLVYRSLLLPFVVLITSVFALCAALATVFYLAKADVILLSGQTQGILFILVIGAATDYSLLYVARYREELREVRAPLAATRRAWRGVVEPIAASGGTVIAGLLCLLLSDLKSNSTLGPVAAIGIVAAMISALTLLPSLTLLLGRFAFWPRVPRFAPTAIGEGDEHLRRGLWVKVGRLVARRPRLTWAGVTVVLLLGAVAATGFRASGVPQSELVLTASSARDGQAALGEHFAPGSGSPALVLVPEDEFPAVAAVLAESADVASVTAASSDSPSGQVALDADGADDQQGDGAAATVVDGRMLLQATLRHAADSAAAEQAVRDLRSEFHRVAPGTLVGGVTAAALDTNDAAIRDRTLIIPIVLVVILLILMLLLRAVLAPVLLIITTALSFGTAMGVSALMFNHVFGMPGADPAVPLFGFVFLVALGIDYNIFLMTRVREESIRHGTRDGVLRGLAVTGGVITSAGIVLAATFAALAVIPILFLAQLAFIVAFGVLLDTFVVRTLLVPALALDIGSRIWWPSRLMRERTAEGGSA